MPCLESEFFGHSMVFCTFCAGTDARQCSALQYHIGMAGSKTAKAGSKIVKADRLAVKDNQLKQLTRSQSRQPDEQDKPVD